MKQVAEATKADTSTYMSKEKQWKTIMGLNKKVLPLAVEEEIFEEAVLHLLPDALNFSQ